MLFFKLAMILVKMPHFFQLEKIRIIFLKSKKYLYFLKKINIFSRNF